MLLTSTYIAKVIHNGVLSLMTFTYDDNTGDIVINSVSKMPGQADGDYVQSVVVTDMRGDSYYSPVIEAQFKNGKASDLKINPEFIGKDN